MRESVRSSRACRIVAAIGASALMAACGGGGGGGGSAGPASNGGGGADSAGGPAVSAPPPSALGPQGGLQALAAAAPVRVNTATTGTHRLLALGTSSGDALGVAWTDDASSVVLQRFDGGDARVGGEVVVSPTSAVQPVDLATASAGVLANGDVVLAYNVPKPAGVPFDVFVPGVGVYFQRFSATGALRTPETLVLPSRDLGEQRTWSSYRRAQVLVLSGGDWLLTADGANYIGSLRQRLDPQGARVGGIVTMPLGIWAPQFDYSADAHGGFTALMAELRFTGRSAIPNEGNYYDVTSYDAAEVPGRSAQGGGIDGLPAAQSPNTLTRLRDGFALVMREWGGWNSAGRPYTGASLRLLDADGQGTRATAALPFVAQQGEVRVLELVDGSFVVGALAADGRWTMQRFDEGGRPMGDLLSAATGGAVPMLQALGGGGLVLAWSASAAAGGSDVFTQRFVPAAR